MADAIIAESTRRLHDFEVQLTRKEAELALHLSKSPSRGGKALGAQERTEDLQGKIALIRNHIQYETTVRGLLFGEQAGRASVLPTVVVPSPAPVVVPGSNGGVNPFVCVPLYPDDTLIPRHKEWTRYYPVCTKFVSSPGRVRPSADWPKYTRNTDVRVFLRLWRACAINHMMHGYVSDVDLLFESLHAAIQSLDWSLTHIPNCRGSVPALLSKLLHAFGSQRISCESLARLRGSAPGQSVPALCELFERYAPHVSVDDCSAVKLGELFVAKLSSDFSLVLCQSLFSDWDTASMAAQKMHNNRVASVALSSPESLHTPFGQHARNTHPPDAMAVDPDIVQQVVQQVVQVLGSKDAPNRSSSGPPSSGSNKICYRFQKNGKCKFGAECAFQHAEREGGGGKCRRCGVAGHWADKCPAPAPVRGN
jgi:hypothetical protein